MVAASRVFSVVVMVLVPGSLLVVAAWVMARLVVSQMRHGDGPHGRRLARAVATVRLKDVVREARALL
jgi:hypothetical protein